MAGTASLRAIIEKLPPFRPRLPWLGGDLQTVRNFLMKPKPPIENWPGQPISFDMADGTGDRLHGLLHRPAEDRRRPLILLVHGIGGSVESAYIRNSSVHLLRAGYPVLRLNLRGAGEAPGSTQQFYHAGRTEDLKQVIGSLDGALAAQGVVPVGFSLGGNLVLKYLAECGALAPVLAAITISGSIDLDAAQRRIAEARNRIYHREILKWVMSEREARHLPREIRTLLDFDNHFVAPANGFKDARDYYRHSSAAPRLGAIRRPTLLIHAEDDPWIPAASYRDLAPNSNLIPLIPRSGGHVGFHAVGSDVPWHDTALATFIGALG
ncbi:YheT family hydrolase [Dongia sp.]|uniref:YheT family hydrolase n=1 Tax=Dongia sp. TaxID=1977262 RepID=UPI0037503068